MHPTSFVERKISIKISIILFVVVAYFVGVFLYSYNLKQSINKQQHEIEELDLILDRTSRLIFAIQQAQNVSNAYFISQKRSDLDRYETISDSISQQIDSLVATPTMQNQNQLLQEVNSKLKEKNKIMRQLAREFYRSNPMEAFTQKIDSIRENVRDSTVIVTRTDSTTFLYETRKRRFWDRVKDVFNPPPSADTIVSRVDVGTVSTTSTDSIKMFEDLKESSSKISADLQRKMAEIEARVKRLVVADEQIFAQIAMMLTNLHQETMHTVLIRSHDNERMTAKVFNFALISGISSLTLILLIFLLIVSDLNAGRKARLALVKEKQLTEQLMESRHKLLLTVSHDVKTPLSSMMGYIDLWLHDETDQCKRRQLQSGLNSGKYILNMLSNLLQYSRLEKQSAKPSADLFDITAMACDTIEMFRPTAEEKKLRLIFDNKAETPYHVQADHTAIRQILSNILSNAVKYTATGSVRCQFDATDEGITFTITDTGVGIDARKVENAFRPFARMNNPMMAEGTGFGLYVSKGLAEAMGGTIVIRSEIGKGTEATIALPLKKVEQQANECIERQRSLPPQSILLFEDDHSLAKMLSEIIRHLGHKIRLADENQTIDNQLLAGIDIALTDMDMGARNGYQVLAAIRQIAPQMPVWLITAHGGITESEALKEGFSGLITKPITINSLSVALGSNHETEEQPTNADELTDIDRDFPLLSAMFDGDRQAVIEIIQQLVAGAPDNIRLLKQAIAGSDFRQARRICHRIYPFMAQLGTPLIDLDTVARMNSLSDADEHKFPDWKHHIETFIDKLTQFCHYIEHNYEGE